MEKGSIEYLISISKSTRIKKLGFRNPVDFLNGLVLLVLALSFIFMAGCGSDNTGNPALGLQGLHISCADASNASGAACDATREGLISGLAASMGNGPAQAIFNAGNVKMDDFVYYSFETVNNLPRPARVYVRVHQPINGCPYNESGTYPFDIGSGETAFDNTGMGIRYGDCITPGPQEVYTVIYNGSHLGLDDIGLEDTAADEVLYETIIRFNFI